MHYICILKSSVLAYLDLLSSDGLQLRLLSDGEGVDEDLWAGGDRHFEVVTILLDLRNALDIFAFLDEFIRETLRQKIHWLKKVLHFIGWQFECSQIFFVK